MKNRPEIIQLDFTEKISKSLVSVSKSENKPNLVAVGNYSATSGLWDTDWDIWTTKWDATLALSIPLFDGFAARGKVKQSQANLEQGRQAKEQVRQGIVLEVEQIYFSLEQNDNIIAVQKENMDTALDNLRVAKIRYEEGLMSSLEIRDAQLGATMAEKNYYQSLADYSIAAAKLEKALGK